MKQIDSIRNGNLRSICLVAAVSAMTLASAFAMTGRQVVNRTVTPENSLKARSDNWVKQSMKRLPVYFEENRGQFDKKVRYAARGTNGFDFFLTVKGAVYVLKGSDPNRQNREPIMRPHGSSDMRESQCSEAVAVFMTMVGGNPEAVSSGSNRLGHRTNYFRGDQSEWRTEIPNFESVRISGVYEGVDAVWHGPEAGGLQYDFVVSPFADPAQIRWNVEGAESVELDSDGDLLITTGLGAIRQKAPFSYQKTDGLLYEIESRFIVEGSEIRIEIGNYDHSKELTIDPLVSLSDLAFSTFLGGADDDRGDAIAVDGAGNVYVTGTTASIAFPTNPGTFDPTQNGGRDVFVTKLNGAGSGLIYSTFLGGSNNDFGGDIAVDTSGNALLTGMTADAPSLYPTTIGAFDTTHNGSSDVFVTKLNATGSSLIYSTLLGGSGLDQGYSIATDPSGNAFVTGSTDDAATDFPTTAGAFDTTQNGSTDVFVAKLNPTGSGLLYSTFIGGDSVDTGWDIAVDSSESAFLTGSTLESAINYPTTAGAFDTTHNGFSDVFVTRLNSTGSSLSYSTFIGGSDFDQGSGIAADGAGNAYLTGRTVDGATDYPTTAGAFDTTHNGVNDVFVTKVNTDGSALTYSTLIGGSDYDAGSDIVIDRFGNSFLTGFTTKTLAAASDYPTTVNAYDTIHNGSRDVFVTMLDATGSVLSYSTFIGGNDIDVAEDVAIDAAGNLYVTGRTVDAATDYPATAGAFDTNHNGGVNDVFISRFGNAVPRFHMPFDFDGDGKSDVSIYRPSLGQWWLNRSTDGVIAHTFGNSSDRIVPVDFTGDGKADVAIYRPSAGEWFVLRSEDYTFYSFPFGNSTDTPVPADYDGDGKTDAAVFRSSNSTWYIQRSSDNGTTIEGFGAAGDVPVPADYDGDAKADIAIYRPSLGQWWLKRSTAGVIAVTFGNSADKPVQGDYTGDGKTDIAIWRPSSGEWFILRSEDYSFYSFPFGSNGDTPVPGDYDGDGRWDAAVFRAPTATWYLNRSTAGVLIQGFGLPTDLPVPAAFVTLSTLRSPDSANIAFGRE